MKLMYCATSKGNFGDDLNLWLWNELFPEGFFDDDETTQFYGIGTILHRKIDPLANKVVFGSGAGYKRPPVIDDKYRIYFVRGKMTASALRIDPEYAITDPAYLVRNTEYFQKPLDRKYAVSFIPHHLSVDDLDWHGVLEQAGIHYINPSDHYLSVIDQIRQSESVITESLHGAILADAFRVPWLPAKFGYRFLNSKWMDWCESVDIGFSAVDLPLIYCEELRRRQAIENFFKQSFGFVRERWKKKPFRQSSNEEIRKFTELLRQIPSSHSFYLSENDVFERIMERLTSKVGEISADFRNGCFKSN